MTYNAEEDAMVRFLLQDRDHAGNERCPGCSSGEIQAKRNHRDDIEWAPCEDCGYNLITSDHFPPRDLSELPDKIRAYYEYDPTFDDYIAVDEHRNTIT